MGFTKRTERPTNRALLRMRDAGITQREIANMYGRTHSTVAKWMREAEREEERAYNASTSIPQTRVVSTRKGK